MLCVRISLFSRTSGIDLLKKVLRIFGYQNLSNILFDICSAIPDVSMMCRPFSTPFLLLLVNTYPPIGTKCYLLNENGLILNSRM
jgi:hypothetical protein